MKKQTGWLVLLLMCGAAAAWLLRDPEDVQPVQETVSGIKQKQSDDIAYGTASDKQKLDLYMPAEKAEKMPVIIHLHGGGWSGGTKKNVGAKPAFFTAHGYIFVSANYRLHPDVSYQDMAQDAASVVKWVYEHAEEYSADQKRINVMGHSAGGHLAALIGADPVYLQKAGLPADVIHSLVILDGPLDITSFVQVLPKYKKVFGEDAAKWREASPIVYMQSGRFSPVLIVTRWSNPAYLKLAQTAKERGNEVIVYDKSQSLSHSEVNTLLGDSQAGEQARNMSDAVLSFLQRRNAE